MDNNTEIPQRKRGMVFLAVAILMLVLGETVLLHSLNKTSFIIYWLVCFVFTGLAIVFSFLDVAVVQRRARAQQRELLEKTVGEIVRQKEAGGGGSKPK
jgi:hypothetical protein